MVVMCAGCDRPILDRFLLNVLDRAWHSGCVQCSDCKDSLSEKCFFRDGKLYCRQDFFRRFGTKCSGCSREISPNELVRRARSRVYHLKCFNCLVCGKQLSTGEELYMVDEHRFICRHDYLAKFQNGKDNDLDLEPSTFENTEDAFSDNDVSADDIDDVDDDAPRDSISGHVLLNPNCNPARPHNSNTNTNSNGGVVGGNRGLTLGPSVAGAPHPVSPRFVVGGVQRPQSSESSGVEPGASSRSGGVVIKQEKLNNADSNCSADSLCSSSGETGTGNGTGSGTGSGTGTGNGTGTGTGSHKDVKDADNNNSKEAAAVESAATGKRRGPRTTIKAKQLETLKAAFAATPKPTRHIREQLAQETGLNMRVIQVWFQNRRSKERRMKQLSVLGVRRQFYRNPRRLRALRPGEELCTDELGQTGFNYFTDNSDFYTGYPGYGDYFAGHHHPIPDPEVMNYLPPTSGHQPNQHLLDQVTGQSIHDGPSFLTEDLGLRSSGSPPEPPSTTPMGPHHPHDAHFGGGAQGLPRHAAMAGLQGPFAGGGRYPEIW